MTNLDPLDIQVLAVLLILLAGVYVWVRNVQRRQKTSRQMKMRCRDLILENRHALAAAGVDIEGLIDLVRMQITCQHLEAVIKLLTRPRKMYNVDQLDDPEYLEVKLDEDGRLPATAVKEKTPEPAAEGAAVGSLNDVQAQAETASEAAVPREEGHTVLPDRMEPEEEKSWLKLVHKRFREAIAKRGISERRARLRLLVKMVELGKKAVDDDQSKSFARKEYERGLWDRFYENEYLELNAE